MKRIDTENEPELSAADPRQPSGRTNQQQENRRHRAYRRETSTGFNVTIVIQTSKQTNSWNTDDTFKPT